MQNGQNGLGRNNSGRRRPWLLSVLGATALLGACDGAPVEQAAGEVTTDEEQNSLSPDVTPRCVTIKEGGATSCKDEKTWRGYGEASCKAKGLGLKSVMFANSCGMASWREATYTCCDAVTPPPPPPPPPGMCLTETLSTAAGLCIDDSTWKTRAEAFCKAKGLSVKTLAFGTACRASGVTGHIDVKVECCGPTTPPPPPPPPPGMCLTETLSTAAGLCIDDSTWKTRAEAFCKAKGLSVKTLAFGTACRASGVTGHIDVKVECCGPTTPPPPPPPPGMCFVEPMKDPMGACLDDAAWKTRAESVCKAKGATVKSLAFGTVCRTMTGIGHSDARVECCGPTTPPPPPPPPPVGRCTWNPLPSMGVCRLPDVWKREATTFCSTKMQTLHDLKLDKPCAMGGFVAAEAECCDVTTPPPPPPPPPSMCVGAVIGDATKCQTEVALKSEAERTCNARGLKLTAFAAFDPCGAMAQYRQAKFTCCK